MVGWTMPDAAAFAARKSYAVGLFGLRFRGGREKRAARMMLHCVAFLVELLTGCYFKSIPFGKCETDTSLGRA